MNRYIAATFISICSLVSSPEAHAEFSGVVGSGVIVATGNSNSSSFNGTLALKKTIRSWTHELDSELYKASSEGTQSANRWLLGLKSKRRINHLLSAWGLLTGEHDRFANIDRRYLAVAGLGFQLLLDQSHELEIDIGLGLRRTTISDEPISTNETVGYLGLNYEGALSRTTKITQKLSIATGQDNSLYISTSGLRVKLSDRLSLVIAYNVRRNSALTGDRGQKMDALTTITVTFEF